MNKFIIMMCIIFISICSYGFTKNDLTDRIKKINNTNQTQIKISNTSKKEGTVIDSKKIDTNRYNKAVECFNKILKQNGDKADQLNNLLVYCQKHKSDINDWQDLIIKIRIELNSLKTN